MSSNIKKGLILCNFCHNERDGQQIYTARKQFSGFRIVDILEAVTKIKIPTNMPVKLCSICAATLHATTDTIEKTARMVSKLMPIGKNQKEAKDVSVNQKEPKSVAILSTDSDSEDVEEVQAKPSITNGTPKKQAPKVKQQLDKTATPSKQPKATVNEEADDGDESLKNVIKLMPAKETPNKSKAFVQLFGNSVNNISDSENESEEEEETATGGPTKKNIAMNFECKMCDFTSVYPNPMKRHMKDLHAQKRPRIYDCMKCAKSFGVLKTLKIHLTTHGILEEKKNEPEPELAVLTALKPKGQAKPLVNAEYTFAIQDTNSSTPKDQKAAKQPFQCEVCQEMHNTIKGIQDHMKTVHGVQRPKLFKCNHCEAGFMHKITFNRHLKMKHGEGSDQAAKPVRRNTVDERSFLVGKEIKAAAQIKKAAIARRKTIDTRVSLTNNKEPSKVTVMPPLTEDADKKQEEIPKVPKTPRELIADGLNIFASPKMSKAKESKEVTLAKLVPIVPTPSPAKKSKSKKDMDLLNTPQTPKSGGKTNGELESGEITPTVKPKKSKKDSKSIGTPQTTPISKGAPTISKSKKVSESIDSPISNGNGTSIIFNSKKEDSIIYSPQISGDTPKPKKKDLDTLDAPMESTDSSLPKRKRKKSEKSIIEVQQIDEVEQSRSKKSKKTEATEVIELLDEINTQPVPHRRELLELSSQDSGEFPQSCSQCDKVVVSRKRLISHINKKHKPTLYCRNCEAKFADSLEFVGHFASCDASAGLPCGIQTCDKVFSAANFLSSHLKKKHKFN